MYLLSKHVASKLCYLRATNVRLFGLVKTTRIGFLAIPVLKE
ncbi:hypothetical protein P20429_0768 [Pseudoalteromonas sp. BSi20429]|nr:hypothetical protein P20429_0768 [Pseudoalteromonas sp. BSi20429]